MEKEAVQFTYQWIADTGYSIRRVNIVDDRIDLEIYGAGEQPVLSELGDQLNASIGQPIKLRLIVVPSEQEEYVPLLE